MSADTSGYGSVLLGNPGQSRKRLRVRVQVLLTVLLISTNVIGAGIVFVLSAVVIPSPAANRGTTLSLATKMLVMSEGKLQMFGPRDKLLAALAKARGGPAAAPNEAALAAPRDA